MDDNELAALLRDDADLLANSVDENTWDIAEHLIAAADAIEELVANMASLQEEVDYYSELLFG